MPELPEVETVRRGLERLVVGRQVMQVERLNPGSMPVEQSDLEQFVIGATITSVHRRAKVLIINLSTGFSIVCHLKMTGQMVYRGDENWGAGHPNDSFLGNLPDRSTRVIIKFLDGSQLFFNDQRKFGWLKLYETTAVKDIPFIAKLGPEPLQGDPLAEFLGRIRRHKSVSIKAAILDQSVIAGVGNIYADESLWQSKIHPATKVCDLNDDQIDDLLKSIQKVMTESIEAGGSTARNYIQADGRRGDYLQKFANVYNRTGLPCARCGTEISKTRVAGRGTHYCAHCQVIK